MIGVLIYCFRSLVLPINHNNQQVLAYYVTSVMAQHNYTTTTIDTDGQGTLGASYGRARGDELVQ